MDPVLLWSVAGVAVGLAGVLVAVLSHLRAHPKRQLEYAIETIPLVSSRAQIEHLEVSVKGIPITDPHLVTVRLFSNSRADIPSSSFDAGRALVLRVVPHALPISGVSAGIEIGYELNPPGKPGAPLEYGDVLIRPQLIKKKATGTIALVCSGKPEIALQSDSPLIDISVREVVPKPEYASNPFQKREPNYAPWIAFASFAAVFGVLWVLAPNWS